MTQPDSFNPEPSAGAVAAPETGKLAVTPGGAARPKGVQGLGQHASRGLMWGMVQSIVSKIVGFVLQIFLAKLLVEEDFGLVAMTTTVTSVTALIQDPGIRTILIQRQARFERWSTAAFWMSTMLGSLAALAICVIAPFAARFYHEPRLVGLLLVIALGAPIGTLATVTDAKLQIDLRFRFQAQLAWWNVVCHSLLSVLLAWLGWGPYSFVVPMVAVSFGRVLIQWSTTRVTIRPRLELRRWRFLLKDSGVIFISGLFSALLWQGDYMMLGCFHDKAVVGIYFFAFNLSTQTMRLFASNLVIVLFPVLSRVQGDPERQMRAYVRAARVLAIIGLPICVLQAVVAQPLFAILFHGPKWQPAIVVMQLLCVGMAVRMVGSSCTGLMQAQGQFKSLLRINIVASLTFVLAVGIAAWWSDKSRAAMAVAAVAAVHFALLGPVQLWVGIRHSGGRWRDVGSVLLPSVLTCLPAAGIAWLAGTWMPAIPGRAWAQLAAMIALFAAIYLPLIRWAAPDSWRELCGHVESVMNRMSRRGAAPAAVVATGDRT